VADVFDAQLDKLANVLTRSTAGGDKYGLADPSYTTVATAVPCHLSTGSVGTDKELLAKAKEAIAYKKVFLRPWFLDPAPDGSYAPNHAIGATSYNTKPLTHDHWFQIDGVMYDIFQIHNPAGKDHHLEVWCRLVLP